jgi:hypothetical protein
MAPRALVVVVVVVACALPLLLRSTDAAVSSGAAKPKCVPGASNDKACRVGVGHDPENQEEEGAFSRNTMAPAGAPESDDDYSDPDIPDNDRLEVVGH